MAISVVKKVASIEEQTTLAQMREQILSIAEEASADNVIDVVVELSQGRYTVEEPLVFSVGENPGLAHVRLTIKAKPSMKPTISGLAFLSGADFTPVEGTPYYKYQFEKDENGEYPRFYDFFRGDLRLKMARSTMWRNPDALLPEHRRGEVKVDGLYVPFEIAKEVKEKGVGSTQLRIYVQWQHYILRVRDVDLGTTKEVNGETYALVKFYEEFDSQFVCGVHGANNIKNRETFFVNNLANLAEPDTFVYDWMNGTVYVVPANPAAMKGTRYGYTTLSNIFMFKGMTGVTVEHLIFAGLTSPFVCETGYFGTLANREFRAGKLRHAAIVTSNMRELTVKDCSFSQLGGNGLMLCDRTVKANITGCRFVNIAMCGISIGNYRVGNGWADYENQTYNIKVVNNYLEHIGYDYPSSPAVFVGYCDGAKLNHNTIKGCAYSGFAVGDGYNDVRFELGESVNLRNVEIAYNDVRDYMDVCRDGGAIYVTGANCVTTYAPRFNSMHHNIALLEDSGHRDRRGYYLDGSASNWDVYDNVIDNCQLPLFTQYHVAAQYTHHIHMWNIYSTTDIEPSGNHKPYNDNLLGFYAVEEDLATLYEKHPHAKEIADGAGYRDTGIGNE